MFMHSGMSSCPVCTPNGMLGSTMTFAPRFSPDGGTVVFSLERGGNSDIYALDIGSGNLTQLTNAPSIETAPSFSPDGSQIVFESDRSGNQQIYVMGAGGGEARRISGGKGRYGTPVWSPRGDMIAFTKQNEGRFHIGVMLSDGTEERLCPGEVVHRQGEVVQVALVVVLQLPAFDQLVTLVLADPGVLGTIEAGDGRAQRPAMAERIGH